MIIAIASGKGGTGKTTVATNLAISAARTTADRKGFSVHLLDCDVEAPNAALFLNPIIDSKKTCSRLLPVIYSEKCDGCGKCAQVCVYNAIAIAGGKPLFFKELCHACGSCTLNCPHGAISEEPESIGYLESGTVEHLRFAQGLQEIGFSSPVPVIRDLKKWALPTESKNSLVFLDAAPGCACPVIETIRGADYALLVTEPTPFGLHDLEMVVEEVKHKLGLPCGVVINKAGRHDDIIEKYCQSEHIPILGRIPFSRSIAEEYAVGGLLIDLLPEYAPVFNEILERVITSANEAKR